MGHLCKLWRIHEDWKFWQEFVQGLNITRKSFKIIVYDKLSQFLKIKMSKNSKHQRLEWKHRGNICAF
jgi:hypothetical protein